MADHVRFEVLSGERWRLLDGKRELATGTVRTGFPDGKITVVLEVALSTLDNLTDQLNAVRVREDAEAAKVS